ncbi:hypothetical protein WJX73_003587 [Symbiochloris irregularis]|uniref:Uncharacterized protein n=1 Tax=Symbiochloris irregularis TaxID=706552 RepID=A0AAW1PLH7_9CHLO
MMCCCPNHGPTQRLEFPPPTVSKKRGRCGCVGGQGDGGLPPAGLPVRAHHIRPQEESLTACAIERARPDEIFLRPDLKPLQGPATATADKEVWLERDPPACAAAQAERDLRGKKRP